MKEIQSDLNKGNLQVQEPAVRNNISTNIEKLKNAVANIQSLKDIKANTGKVNALKKLAESDNVNLECLNELAEIRLRIARKGGEILAKSPKNKGGRKSTDNDKEHVPTYTEQGISKRQAMRWQDIFAIPLTIFEMLIAKLKEEGEQITDAYFQRAHDDLFPSANIVEKTGSEENDSIDNSGEMDIVEDALEEKLRKKCPYCSQKRLSVKILATKNVDGLAA